MDLHRKSDSRQQLRQNNGACSGKKLAEFSIDGKILLTERPGHATELSAQAVSDGATCIIAVGGDGTFNEVARPLVGKPDIVTGIIPAGTGNDFNQIPGFTDRFTDKEWQLFFSHNVKSQDVGVVNNTIFLNGLGIGFDAEVAAQNYSEDGSVRKGGGDKYIWHIVKTLLFFREKNMVALTEEGRNESFCFINTISIGRRFAGSFYLTPEAIADDGLLDVCFIRKINLFHRFRLLLKVPSGKHILDRRVHYYRTPSLRLEFPVRVPYHVDGEIFFADKFDIKVLPGALNIIYNPEGKHFFRNA